MRKPKRDGATIRPDGETIREQWYALARRYCKIIANRQRTNARCKKCFCMRLRKRDMKNYPRFGCEGCVEMDSFLIEAAALLEARKTNQIWQILC